MTTIIKNLHIPWLVILCPLTAYQILMLNKPWELCVGILIICAGINIAAKYIAEECEYQERRLARETRELEDIKEQLRAKQERIRAMRAEPCVYGSAYRIVPTSDPTMKEIVAYDEI